MPLSQVRTQATLPQDTIIEEEVLTTHEDKISDAETDHAVDEVMRTTVFFFAYGLFGGGFTAIPG